MGEVYFKKGDNYKIDKNSVIKCTEYKSSKYTEIQKTKDTSKYLKLTQKINKEEYIDKRTGEIKRYKIGETKSEETLKKSMRKLRKILKNNFQGAENELFITLTTANNTTDIEIIKKYFKKFYRKLKKKYGALEFVYVIEKHKNRGGWHIHTLIKHIENRQLYIDNRIIEALWKQGFTKTRRINSGSGENGIDKVISYLTKTRTKKEIPNNQRCYYKSRRIQKPKTYKIKYGEFCEGINDSYRLESQKTTLILSERTDKIINVVKTEKWKQIK